MSLFYIHRLIFLNAIYFCVTLESLRHTCVFSGVFVYLCEVPHGIPKISIPVDVFDVFEAT